MNHKLFNTRKNPLLYEINTAAWLYELSKKLGRRIKLGEVPPEEWCTLSGLGFELVWLMGIWKRSPAGRKIAQNDPGLRKVYDAALLGWTDEDIIGSSYSVSGHEPDPSIGTWEDIDAARAELHRHGIGLILDFIPNHTGTDHPWVDEHPEYYVQGTAEDYKKDHTALLAQLHKGRVLYLAKGRDPYFPPWSDTVQLNYFNPELRNAMLKELEKISSHCDGVRCDMAMLILNDIFHKTWGWAINSLRYEPPSREFWSEALDHLPGLIWIAETYWDTEQKFLELGFEFVYDKKLYDLLRWSSLQKIQGYLKSDSSFQQKMLRFLENHDEDRAVTVFGKNRLTALVAVFSTLPGMKLYHHGQLNGKSVRLPLQLRQGKTESSDPALRALYEKTLRITIQETFHSGIFQLREVLPAWDSSYKNIIAYTWSYKEHLKLVVGNLSAEWSQGKVRIQELDTNRHYTLVDELNGKAYTRNGKEMADTGLHVILEGWQAHVFDFS